MKRFVIAYQAGRLQMYANTDDGVIHWPPYTSASYDHSGATRFSRSAASRLVGQFTGGTVRVIEL